MINQTEEKMLLEDLLIAKHANKQEIFTMLERKCAMLETLHNRYHQCTIELCKNSMFMRACEYEPKIDTKKQNKFIKSLEKTEQELQELRDLIIRQNELKKVSSAEFEDVFEQTKIQMNIRKNDLKKKIKDLKAKIQYCEDEPLRSIEYLTSANECLEKEIENLKLRMKEEETEIKELEKKLKEISAETTEGVNV